MDANKHNQITWHLWHKTKTVNIFFFRVNKRYFNFIVEFQYPVIIVYFTTHNMTVFLNHLLIEIAFQKCNSQNFWYQNVTQQRHPNFPYFQVDVILKIGDKYIQRSYWPIVCLVFLMLLLILCSLNEKDMFESTGMCSTNIQAQYILKQTIIVIIT